MFSLIWTATITLIILLLLHQIHTFLRINNPHTLSTGLAKKDKYRIMYERLLEREKLLVDQIDYYQATTQTEQQQTQQRPQHQMKHGLEDVTQEVFDTLESRKESDTTDMLHELSQFVKENDIEK